MLTPDLIYYLMLGAFAGTLAGLLGVGGGLVIVPVLAILFHAQGMNPAVIMQLAIATSLATIVFTSTSSLRAHHLRGAVRWDIFWRLTSGIVLGAGLGAMVVDVLSSATLRTIFGSFELLVAAQMGFGAKPNPRCQFKTRWGLLVGLIIGSVSAIVGIGGGTLTVPFLVWCNVKIQQAVATAAACGLPIALAGSLAMVITGWSEPGLPEETLGYIYLPAFIGIVASSVLFAPLGARLAHRLPAEILKQIFSVFLALLGLAMLLG